MAAKFQRCDFEAELIVRALSDSEFRAGLLHDPLSVYQEALGMKIPEGVKIRVVEERSDEFYVILPHLPSDVKYTQATLASVARRERTHRNPCWGLGDGVDAGAID